jgi:hypothetical protein
VAKRGWTAFDASVNAVESIELAMPICMHPYPSALLNQVRAVDRLRLVKLLGKVNTEAMREVDEATKIAFGLIQL